jgi:putative membrane protein
MNTVTQIAALVGALAYLGAAPMELFFFDRPWARRFLHVEMENVDDVRMWAFCIGFRNALAGAGTIVGLLLYWNGEEVIGQAVVITCCVYLLLASLAMAIADALGLWRPRGGSVLGTVASSLPPLVALVAAI